MRLAPQQNLGHDSLKAAGICPPLYSMEECFEGTEVKLGTVP